MPEKREYLDNLLRMAQRGDAETLSDVIHDHLFRLPWSRHLYHGIERSLIDLLHIVSDIQNESERAEILKSFVQAVSPVFEDEEKWYRYRREFYDEIEPYWDRLIYRWDHVYREDISLAIQIESDKSRVEALLSLTKALGIWFRHPTWEYLYDRRRFSRRWFRREFELAERFLRQIERIETGYWKAKALEALSILVEAIYTTRDYKETFWHLERALQDFEEIAEDQTKVERLRAAADLLAELPPRLEGPPPIAAPPPPRLEEPPEPGGPPLVELIKEVVSELPFVPPSRYADFTFLYGEGEESGKKMPAGHTLQTEQWYQLEVAVRTEPIGIPPEELERRPIREPKQAQDVTVMVTAEGDGFEIAEPVQALTLPPLGDSTENALIRVRPLRKSTSADDLAKIKVRLYYDFNLLEVVVIRAEVVGKFDSPTQSQLGLEKPISFEQEQLEREYIDFDNIQPRTMHIDVSKQGDYFQFNFFFRNDIDQELVFTAPARLPATDLEDDLISIRKIWYDIAMSRTFAEQVEGDKDEFLVNIRSLAKAGRRLWIKLFKRERKSSMYKIGTWLEKHPLKQDGIVQVSLSRDAASFVFPWALVYDRPVPRKNCELPNLEGFWGVRYCIEQQLPSIIKITDEPVHLEEELKLGFMLWEQFRNAGEQKLLMEHLVTQSAGQFRASTPPITDAHACYDLLNNCDSHLLYFYTHGYTRHRLADIGVGPNLDLFVHRYERLDENSPLREIYRVLYKSVKQKKFEPDRSWIELTYGKLYLDDLYDSVENLQSGPFVILNMCESAQITSSLSDSFIHFFLDRGAMGVVGTECPMTVEFAHPFAEEFLGGILAGKQVGNVLLNVRRHFLELRNPLGLAYNMFGSATVCFEPPRF